MIIKYNFLRSGLVGEVEVNFRVRNSRLVKGAPKNGALIQKGFLERWAHLSVIAKRRNSESSFRRATAQNGSASSSTPTVQ
jgi:hypothetical protein